MSEVVKDLQTETAPTPAWHVGQRVVIDRRVIATVDRVTPSGRAVVGDRQFGPDGWGIGKVPTRGSRARLEILTPELEVRLRPKIAGDSAFEAVTSASRWINAHFSRTSIPPLPDIERAERLAAAIRGVMEGGSE